MSEKEEKNQETKGNDVVDGKVALIIAERDSALDLVKELTEKLDAMTKRYENANAIILEDTKAALINKIAPRTKLPKSTLSAMSIDELHMHDKVLGYAVTTTFKSGTPIKPIEDAPEVKLQNMYHDNMAKIRGGN